LWEERLPSLEEEVIDGYATRVEDLLTRATPLKMATGFAIDIDPSGRT
jgi:hypothetical protein